jgi:hypothetical protein
MDKFYVCKGGLAKGPFTLQKLVENGIAESDPVWCAGFKECKPASKVSELKMIFEPRQRQATTGFSVSPPQHNYVLYKKEQHKYSQLLACSLVGASALVIYYVLTLLTS